MKPGLSVLTRRCLTQQTLYPQTVTTTVLTFGFKKLHLKQYQTNIRLAVDWFHAVVNLTIPNNYNFPDCFNITICHSIDGNSSTFNPLIPGFDLHCLSCTELCSVHLLFMVMWLLILCGKPVDSKLQWTASVSYVAIKCLVLSNLINYYGCIKLYRILYVDERVENKQMTGGFEI